jgi:hypothetical protein
METDVAVEKTKNVFPTATCKTLRVSHRFHRLGGDELNKPKPDRSFATKTGHFHLLPTGYFFQTPFNHGTARRSPSTKRYVSKCEMPVKVINSACTPIF